MKLRNKDSQRKILRAALAASNAAMALLVTGVRSSSAAGVIWSTPTTIGANGNADVGAGGTSVYAYDFSNSGTTTTLNGVTFTGSTSTTAAGSNITLSGFNSDYTAFGGGSSMPYATLSSGYQTVINGGIYSSGATAATITLNNLATGHFYSTQFWVDDSRGSIGSSVRTETITSTGGNTQTVTFDPNNTAGTLGQYTTGTFFASAGSQAFTITGNAVSQMNAISVEDLTNLGFWNGTSGSTLDMTTANFGSNTYNNALTSVSLATINSGTSAIYFADSYWNNGTTTPVTNNNLTIAAGGVSTGTMNFINNAVTYTFGNTLGDTNGISGTTAINVTGGGTVIMNGLNTYTGATSVYAGTLRAGVASVPGTGGAFGNNSAITLANFAGVTLDLNGFSTQIGSLSGGGTAGGAVTLGSATLTDVQSTATTFAGSISGGGGITMSGVGTLTLSGANSYTGPTNITAGTLVFATPASLYNSTTASWTASNISVGNGATLEVNVGGPSDLTAAQVNTLITGISGDASGGLQTGSTLALNTANATATVTITSGISNPSGGGAVAFTKFGANTLILSGTDTYTGPTTISAGTLGFAGPASLYNSTPASWTASNISVPSGSTLQLNLGGASGFTTANVASLLTGIDGAVNNNGLQAGSTIAFNTANASTTVSSVIADTTGIGGGSVGVVALGTNTLTLSAASTYSGGTTISAGTVALGITNALPAGGALIINGGSNTALLNLGSFNQSIGNLTVYPGGSIRTVISGTGTLQLNGNVTIADSHSSGLDWAVAIANPVDLNGSTRTFSVGWGNNNDSTDLGDFHLLGIISNSSGTAGVTIQPWSGNGTPGTVALEAANTYNGPTTLTGGESLYLVVNNALPNGSAFIQSGGTLDLTAAGKTTGISTGMGSLTGSGSITLGSTGQLTIGYDNTSPAAYSGIISGTGGKIVKTGTGTLTLTGANTYTGTTTVNGGTLNVSGAGSLSASTGLVVGSGATFNYLPNTSGTMTVASLSLAGGSTIGLQWANGSPFNSAIAATGAATLTGTSPVIDFNMTGSFLSGHGYTVLTAASGLGTASNYAVLGASNFTYAVAIGSGGSSVTITPTTATSITPEYWVGGLAGNANIWSASNGSTASNWAGDSTGTATPLIPGAATNLFFSASGATGQGSMILGSNMFANSISVNGTVNSPNETNNLVLNNPGNYTLTLGSTSGAGITMNAGSGSVTLNPNIALGFAQSWANNSSNALIVNGAISGSTLLTLNGSGVVTLSGANTSTGGLTLASGQLNINNATALGATASTFTISGGVIDNTSGAALTLTNNNPMAWKGSFTFNGSNNLNLGTGAVTLSTAAPTVTVNNSSTLTVGGAFSGAFALTKAGTGSLVLGSLPTAAGTTVSAGILQIPAATISSTNPIGVSSGANLNLTGEIITTANSSGQLAAITGGAGGSININWASSATTPAFYFNSNDSANSGTNYGTTINVPVNLGSNQAYIWGNTNHNSVGEYAPNTDITFSQPISGSGGITLIAQDTYSGSMEVPLYLDAANTFTGPVVITRGSVYLGNAGALDQATATNDENVLSFNPTSGNNARFYLYGNNASISDLQSSGAGTSVIANSPGHTATAATLTINEVNNTTYAGTIVQVQSEYSSTGTVGALSVIKNGVGKLTLSGANTYTGTTTINQGELAVTGSLGTGAISVAGTTAATLSGSGIIGGPVTVKNLGTLTAGAGGAGNLTVTGLTFGSASTDAETLNVTDSAIITDSGSLTVNSGTNDITVNLGGAAPGLGEFPILTYTGTTLSSIGAFNLVGLPSRVLANLVNNTSNHSLDINVTGVDFPVWTGSASNLWNTTDINWVLNSNNSTTTQYIAGDSVLFSDLASSSHTTITINGADVTPGGVTFNNSVNNYILNGTNAIAGSTGLIKSGSGSLTINNTNSFTGAVTLNGGTIGVATLTNSGVNSPLGAGTSLIFNGGILSYAGGTTSTNRGITVQSGGGAITDTTSAAITLSGAVSNTGGLTLNANAANGSFALNGAISGSGGLTLNGPTSGSASFTLGNSTNSYAGPTTVNNNATLNISADTDLGTAPGIATANSLLLNSGTTLATSATFTLSANRGIAIGSASGSGSTTFNVASGAALTYNGIIANNGSGTGQLVLSGAGAVVLGGSNTFTGGTNLNAGQLFLTNGNALGGATGGTLTIVAGASTTPLVLATNSAITIPNNIVLPSPSSATTYVFLKAAASSSTGTQLTLGGNITGGGSHTELELNSGTSGDSTTSYAFTGTNSFIATINVNRGYIVVSNPSSLGNSSNIVQIDGNGNAAGDLQFANSMNGLTFANPITMQENDNVGVGSNNVTFSGQITGDAFQKVGTGVATLTNTNNSQTATTIGAGTLNISADGSLGASAGALTIATGTTTATGATLQAGGPFNSNRGIVLTGTNTATIDTQANSVTLNGVISNGASATAGLTKIGSGTLTLTNASMFTGPTNINGGTLTLNNGSLAAASAVTVANGATLSGTGAVGGSVTVNNAGTLTAGVGASGNLDVGSLTFGTISTDTATVNVTPGSAWILSAGGITGNGTVTINVGGGAQAVGTYPLINYTGSIPSSPNFVLGTLPNLEFGNLTVDAGAIDLNVTGTDFPVWTGANGSAWDNSTTNWVLNSTLATTHTPVAYQDGETVMFNDNSLVASTTVDISSGNVAPANVIFDNNTTNYVLSGSNGITGTTGLTLNGAGTVTITDVNNSFTGDVTLNAGTLVVSNIANSGLNSAIGAGSSIVFGGGTLQYTGSTTSTNRGITLGSGGGSVNVSNPATSLTLAGLIAGSGGLTVNGSGTVVLSGANTYSGGTTMASGTLSVATLALSAGASNIGSQAMPVILGGSSTSGILSYTGNSAAYTGGLTVNAGGGEVDVTTSGQTLTIATGAINGSGNNLTIGGAGNTIINSTVNLGSGTLVKNGAGILTLGANNTSSFTGGVTLNGGYVSLSNAGGLGSGALTVNTGNSVFLATTNMSGAQTIANNIVLPADTTAGSYHTIYITGGTGSVITLTGNITGGGSNSGVYLNNTSADGNAITEFAGTNSTFVTQASQGIILNRGAIQVDNANALGASSNSVFLDSYAPNRIIFGGSFNYTHPTSLAFTTGTFDTGSNTVTASGAISGGEGLNKISSGTLILTGTNTYTGGTTITAGTLSVGNLAISGGNLGTSTAAIVLGGTTSGGTLSYTGNTTTYTNGLTVSAGGGEIDVTTAGQNLTLGTGAIAAAGPLTFGQAGNTTVTSNITGAGGITMNGTGTLTLSSAASTFTGGTTISSGTVIAGADSGYGGPGPFGNSILPIVLGNADTSISPSLLIGGPYNIAVPIIVLNQATIGGNNNAGSATFSGAITANQNLAVTQAAGGALNIMGGISGSAGFGQTATVVFNNAGAVNVGSGAIVDGSGGGNTAISQTGPGITTLSGSNNYSGGTTVSAGTLVAGSSSAFGLATSAVQLSAAGSSSPSLLIGGAFTVANPVVIGSAPGTYTIGASNPAGTATFSGPITANQNLYVAQSSSGTLDITGGITGNATATNTIQLNFNGAGNVTVGGAGISDGANGGNTTVIQSGSGATTLNAANTYTGGTTVTGGTLIANAAGSLGSSGLMVLAAQGTNAYAVINSYQALQPTAGVTVNADGNVNFADTVTNGSNVIATLNGAGSITLNSNNTSTNSATTNLAITSGGGFSGSIGDTYGGLIGPQTGFGSITVAGGTLSLSGNNFYNGGTSVIGGTLLANTTGPGNSATGYGNVVVGTGGILGGGAGGTTLNGNAGQINGSVIINNGATPTTAGNIAPGNPLSGHDSDIGTLAIGGDLTLQGAAPAGTPYGGTYYWKVDPATGAADQITVGGTLTIDTAGGPFNLVIESFGATIPQSQQTYIIAQASSITVVDSNGTATYTGGASFAPVTLTTNDIGDFSVTDNLSHDWEVQVVPDSGGGVDLEVTGTVPEPGSLGLIGMASLGLLRRRRSNRKAMVAGKR